jgi:UDP-GlcNAc:undecaprenyl-phosphate GlcNAc-1-phosphate transferase
VFLAAAGTVAVVTPLVRLAALRLGAIDRPSDRKVHPKATPTIGGVGILMGVLVGFGVAALIPAFRSAYRESSALQGTLFAVLVVTAVGVVDDVRTLSAPAKAAGQVLAAGLLILNSVEILLFWFPGQGVVSLGSDLAVPLTVLWVLIMVNAVNLIDGLDGLAAGIVIIAATAFFIWIQVTPATPSVFGTSATTAALLSAIAAGSAIGFLPYNFHPARIFMGDSGAMQLGLLLAAATISGVGRTIQPTRGDIAAFSIPVLIPAIVLAIPLADVAMAIVRRLRHGRPIFAPDKEHIHHQLMEIGNTHRRAVLIMYFWSALLAGAALWAAHVSSRITVVLIGVGVLALIALTYIPKRIIETRRARARANAEHAAVSASASGLSEHLQGS